MLICDAVHSLNIPTALSDYCFSHRICKLLATVTVSPGTVEQSQLPTAEFLRFFLYSTFHSSLQIEARSLFQWLVAEFQAFFTHPLACYKTSNYGPS